MASCRLLFILLLTLVSSEVAKIPQRQMKCKAKLSSVPPLFGKVYEACHLDAETAARGIWTIHELSPKYFLLNGYEAPDYTMIRKTAVENKKMVDANQYNVKTELLLVPPEDFGRNEYENMILATYNYVNRVIVTEGAKNLMTDIAERLRNYCGDDEKLTVKIITGKFQYETEGSEYNMLAKIVIDKRKDKGLRQALVVADGGPYPDNIRNADNKCYKFRYDDELDVDFVCLDADQFMEIIGQPEKKRFPIIQK